MQNIYRDWRQDMPFDTMPTSEAPVQEPTLIPFVGTQEDPNELVLGKVICEEDMPNLARVQFRILPGRHTTVGRMVGVRGKRPDGRNVLTLVRVDGVWEKNPHEDA